MKGYVPGVLIIPNDGWMLFPSGEKADEPGSSILPEMGPG